MSYELLNADFRQNSTGSKRLQTPYPLGVNDQIYQQGNISSIRSNFNIFSLKPDVRRKRRSYGVRRNGLARRKQRLDRSLDDLLRIAKNNCTVDMSFYMPCLLFRYQDWNQSWMRQIEEVYAIQIYLNLKLDLYDLNNLQIH